MPDESEAASQRLKKPEWFIGLAKYERPDVRRAIGQMIGAILPYLALWALMLYTVTHGYAYWITLSMSVVAAGLLMRSFIFLHDCSHGSFFPSPRANAMLGFLVGVMALTPFGQWRWSHLKHHATFANLDQRGAGDVWLMTVDEYQAAPRLQRLAYWIYRHPLFMFGIGSTLLFALLYRIPNAKTGPHERNSVLLTDGAILAVAVVASLTVGFRAFILVLAPIVFIAWTLGVWLFYVQHQFEGVYWARQPQWDYFRASLEGSSYYRLPKVLQWFTGNIGLHHLHHLRAHIPNYHLQQAFNETPAVQAVTPLTLRSSLRSLRLNLYDERRQQLINFHDLDQVNPADTGR